MVTDYTVISQAADLTAKHDESTGEADTVEIGFNDLPPVRTSAMGKRLNSHEMLIMVKIL